MLISNLQELGNKLYAIRKEQGLTQAEVAEKADLSDRTYADIERGYVNMRTDTLLKICAALRITPNEILTKENPRPVSEEDLYAALAKCSEAEKQTALKLLEVYTDSLHVT